MFDGHGSVYDGAGDSHHGAGEREHGGPGPYSREDSWMDLAARAYTRSLLSSS